MKYPLCLVPLTHFPLKTIETLVIGGDVELVGFRSVEGTYPSLSRLEFTERVPRDIRYMSAPSLRHLILRNADLFCHYYPCSAAGPQPSDAWQRNRELLEMLASRFPTVEVLEIHENLRKLVLEMVLDDAEFFIELSELWVLSKSTRNWINLDH